MRYSFAVAVFLGTLILDVRADDERPSKARIAYDEIYKDFLQKASEAKTPTLQKALFESFTQRYLEHGKKYSTDPTAVKALMGVVQLNQSDKSKDGPRAQALALLGKDHLKSPTIAESLLGLAEAGDNDLERLAQDVAASHPDKRIRALACRALIRAGDRLVARTQILRGDGPEKFEKKFGESVYERHGGEEAAKRELARAYRAEAALPGYRARLKGELKGALPDVSVGAEAPPLRAVDFKGKEVKLSDLKGKVVVVHFWATAEMSSKGWLLHDSQKLIEEMEGRPFMFVSVSTDEQKETVEKYLKKEPMPWTHWWIGRNHTLLENWDADPRPRYVIDHKGIIRSRSSSYDFQDNINHSARKLVEAIENEQKPKEKNK